MKTIWAVGVVFVASVVGCADDQVATCSLDGEPCDSFAFYKVTEDRPLFQEPGPHGYMLLVRAQMPGSEEYFEYAEQGRQASSSIRSVSLEDPRVGDERPYPPLTQLLVPESHTRGVEGSIHWYGWGEVTREVDFEAGSVTVSFGPMTFLNRKSGEEWAFERSTSIRAELDVLCWTADQEPADPTSEFCRQELPRAMNARSSE